MDQADDIALKPENATPERGPGRASKRVTMTDVARMAGCSQSTVSIVLNGTPGVRISRETKRRVYGAVEALGYKHQKAAPKRNEGIAQIAIVFDQIATSPEPVVSFDGAREEAWKTGHILSAFQTNGDTQIEPRTIEAALSNRVAAIIYATVMTRQVKVPSELYDIDTPVVLLNCYSSDRRFPAVVPGEVAGGHRATNALINAGHVRIAHISGEMWMDASKDRLRGYREALATADIPFDPELVREGNWQPSAGYAHTRALMLLPNPPSGIFCANDRMAVGCYEALKEGGFRIPDDVSVVGYDDEEVAKHLSPQLTTLVLPHRAMGHWAVDRALSLTDHRREKYQIAKLECPLISRGSVAPPSKNG